MKNKYRVIGSTVVIDVKRKSGEVRKVFVSKSALPKLKQLDTTWCLMQDYSVKSREKYYVVGRENGKQILLHTYLMGKEEGRVIDHIDGNPLNNRFSNLRHLDHSLNALNRQGAELRSKSGIHGVAWIESKQRWRARVKYKGKAVFEKLYRKDDLDLAEKEVREFREQFIKSGNAH